MLSLSIFNYSIVVFRKTQICLSLHRRNVNKCYFSEPEPENFRKYPVCHKVQARACHKVQARAFAENC